MLPLTKIPLYQTCQDIIPYLNSSQPQHYTINLKPDIPNLIFHGNTTISVDIIKSSNTVTLHADSLEFYNTKLVPTTAGTEPIYIQASSMCYYSENNYTTFIFDETLTKGESFNLTLEYIGKIDNKDMTGLYVSNLEEQNDNIILATQLGPVYARRVFPCWDEPKFKATFDISLTVPEHLTTLSNDDIESTLKLDNNFKKVFFKRTPRMSSYLVGIVAGEFDYVEDKISDSAIRCRIYVPKGHIKNSFISLNITIKAVELFQEWFQIFYPIPKLDLIELPKHKFAAMENWGILTFKYGVISKNESETMGSVISILHELAHQWFGNLVSVKTWNDYWIKEALSTYFSLIGGHHLFPNLDLLANFQIMFMLYFMDVEGQGKSAPLRNLQFDPLLTSGESFGMLYFKGAGVINMISQTLSHEIFMSRIIWFLNQYQYDVAGSEEFYSLFKDITPFDKSSFFNSWIEQTGYPYFEITESDGPSSDLICLKIVQNNFQNNFQENLKNNSGQYFPIPFTLYSLAPGFSPKLYFMEKKTYSLNVPKHFGYYLSSQQLGFFKVNYSLANIQHLVNNVSRLSIYDKVNLISDVITFSQRNNATLHSQLKLLEIGLTNNEDMSLFNLIMSLTKKFKDLISI